MKQSMRHIVARLPRVGRYPGISRLSTVRTHGFHGQLAAVHKLPSRSLSTPPRQEKPTEEEATKEGAAEEGVQEGEGKAGEHVSAGEAVSSCEQGEVGMAGTEGAETETETEKKTETETETEPETDAETGTEAKTETKQNDEGVKNRVKSVLSSETEPEAHQYDPDQTEFENVKSIVREATTHGYLGESIWKLVTTIPTVYFHTALVVKIEKDWRLVEFMRGATHSYHTIMRGFLIGEFDALEGLLSDHCLAVMKETLDMYEEQGLKLLVTHDNYEDMVKMQRVFVNNMEWDSPLGSDFDGDIDLDDIKSLAGLRIGVTYHVEDKYSINNSEGPVLDETRELETTWTFEAVQDEHEPQGYSWRVVNIA